MAKSNYEIEINGNNKGLTSAVDNSIEELNKLDKAAGGMFQGAIGPLETIQSSIGAIGAGGPAMMAVGAAAAAAGLGIASVQRTLEKSTGLMTIQQQTGTSIELLQQLEQEFKSAGMEVEKFGDINKDALDHLGDSLREGKGGMADDLEQWGIGLEELTKYAYDAEGDIKSVIDVYYKMKAAGKSGAEITNAMETMASDSSHLVSTLQKYNSTAEAMNAINSRSVSITTDTAIAAKEFDANMKTLSVNVDKVAVAIGGPLIQSMKDLWVFFNKDWSGSDYIKVFSTLTGGGSSMVGLADDLLNEKERKFQKDIAVSRKKANAVFEITKKAENDRKDAAAKAKALQEKNDADAKTAAAKAQAERDKQLAEAKRQASEAQRIAEEQLRIREQYIDSLRVLSGLNSEYDFFTKSSDFSGAIKDIQKLQQIKNYLDDFKDQDSKTFTDNISEASASFKTSSELLKISLDQGKITLTEYNRELSNLTEQYNLFKEAVAMSGQGDHRLDGLSDLQGIGFSTIEDDQQLDRQKLDEQFEELREANQVRYENDLIDYQAFLDQKQKLDESYAIKAQAIDRQSSIARLQIADDFTRGVGNGLQMLMGENNKAAQAMFAVSKGLAIANGMINANEAATTAMAKYPGPMGYAMAATSYANVLTQVASMRSMTLGQFHDGIDNVPNTGTYLLQEGERVVDNRLNQDLKDFLGNEQKGQSQAEQPIDASINISGSVNGEKEIMQIMKRQQQALASIVQDANRRRQ